MEDNFMDLLYESPDGLTYGYDTAGDGEIDLLIQLNDPSGTSGAMIYDTDHNGTFDTAQAVIDSDGDGYAETLALAYDYDQDGTPDMIRAYTDTDLDGDAEMVMTFRPETTENGDLAYRMEADIDVDGDHQSDYHYADVITPDSQDFGFPFYGAAIGSPDASGQFDPETPAELVAGDPASDMEVWECQGRTNRCALFSQMFAIEQITGEDIDIEEFAQIAKDNGWFTEEGGTVALNMDKMLEYYGIDHDVVFDANMEQLEAELRDGNKIIVSVDSDQIWYGTDNDIFSPATRADHALQVVGIDYSDPDNPMVVLNDSGTPDGCGEMVPLDVFENAWSSGDHQMVVCRA